MIKIKSCLQGILSAEGKVSEVIMAINKYYNKGIYYYDSTDRASEN